MRLMGGIAALIICVLFGKSKAAVLDMRQRIMHYFALDMQNLAAEMQYRPRDIRDMAHKLAEGNLGGFWQEFAANISTSSGVEQAWEYTAKTYREFDVLSSRETAIIAESGRAIGLMNAEDNVRMLKYRSEQAERQAAELQAQLISKGVVYQKLGLLGGLAVMLLIV